MSKEVIRRGLFETNSSSVHSLTFCTEDEWSKWKNGELYFDKYTKEFVESSDEIETARNCKDDDEAEIKTGHWDNYHRYLTYDEYHDWDYIDFETYDEVYTTPNGETIHAFGYYGHD